MADSATPKPTPANFPSLDALAHLPAWAVALSGGADSTALLIASALRWPDKTHAIHIHHGLQDAADGFATHCETLCQQWKVPLVIVRVQAREIHDNPTPEQLRAFTEEMPQCRVSTFGNVNVQTRVVSRSAASTHVVTSDPAATSGKSMTREEFDRVSALQDAYLRDKEVVVVDGWIGPDPSFRTAARLTIEKANANIAGMQQKLYFPRTDGAEPEVQVIYTPNLPMPGYADDRLIAVDLENNVTRVFNSDYFGESKKGGLRMWNRLVYDRGGLALHAGIKVVPTRRGEKVFLIIGLSGTGKTTTTFTVQNGSLPVQDDFVALMPGGKAYGSENGCFAKTFSLDPDFEPNIYNAVIKPNAYLENVYQDPSGVVNFFEESYTQNGRAVFRMEDLDRVTASVEHEAGQLADLAAHSRITDTQVLSDKQRLVQAALARVKQRAAVPPLPVPVVPGRKVKDWLL